MQLKGQLSFEYMLIALIALSLVTISFAALSKIRENAEAQYEIQKTKAISLELFTTIDEVCALGNGNTRTLFIGKSLGISSGQTNTEYYISLSDGTNSFSHTSYCHIHAKGVITNEISVENENGEIKIGK